MSPVLGAIVNTFWLAAQLVRDEKRLLQSPPFGGPFISWIKVIKFIK